MNIEIDGVLLIRTEQNQAGAAVEISNISNINTSDKRNIIEHEIPGMEGNVFQNLGRSAVRISFDGTFQGKTAKSKLETIRSKFKKGTPVPFNSDISGATDVTKVMIEDLRIDEVAGLTDRFQYSIVLREYKEPPPEPTTPPSQDGQAEEWADNVAGETVDSINYITGKVLDSEGNPKSGVAVLVTSDEGEYTLETNEEGIYRIDDLPPGDYKVTVDLEEYAGIEKEVTIGGGAESGAEEPTSQAAAAEGSSASAEEEKPEEEQQDQTEQERTEEQQAQTEQERTEEQQAKTEQERTEEQQAKTEQERTEEQAG